MNNRARNLGRVVALSGLSATSLYAAQPPNPSSVLSDGFYNTAMGTAALSHDLTPAKQCSPYAFDPTPGRYYMSGCGNTAAGFGALDLNSTGAANTALGAGALYSDTSGSYNTAVGMLTLFHTTTGHSNQAFGVGALFSDTSGYYNVATGDYALFYNTIGALNVASGTASMYATTTGSRNTGLGFYAQLKSQAGSSNVAVGAYALDTYVAGDGNTALGTYAGGIGKPVTSSQTGSYNTYVGFAVGGAVSENYVTRIGVTKIDPNVQGSPTTYIAGIANTGVTGGVPVYVTPSGQLGFSASSERYKTAITTLAADVDRVNRLRPVSFHVKDDPGGSLQYGLIAEEVDKVYPDLVIRDAAGAIQGVRYDELAPLLLGEVQRQAAVIADLQKKDAELQRQLAHMGELERRLDAVLDGLNAGDGRVAHR